MNKSEVLSRIHASGAVAVVRVTDVKRLRKTIAAIAAGGVDCIEITMTVPNAIATIKEFAAESDALVGAGTVTDADTARAVIEAGAQFIVGPVLNLEVIAAGKNAGVAVMPGCFSPTEILAAWNAGADVVKVFPATSLGPKFIKDVHGPLPHVRLMPTGGVSIENAGEWIRAGAFAVGIGTDLLDKTMIEAEDYSGLTHRARVFVENIRSARAT
jgi:2-dehydro-3-deoxyphosphogluconate aldolase/(4S)-4-hydroxy-2-oxoglutarate aldolase